jgi:hypothetical protein
MLTDTFVVISYFIALKKSRLVSRTWGQVYPATEKLATLVFY